MADDGLGFRRQAAGGRGGCGNIANKDQFAPPPPPMRVSLEVQTVANRVGVLPNSRRSRCPGTDSFDLCSSLLMVVEVKATGTGMSLKTASLKLLSSTSR